MKSAFYPTISSRRQAAEMAIRAGFTLIELSIVLVIIGLIVGGVLVGQDLIRAAAERAQISQIEKFNTAVNTFRGKYSYLPGDLNQYTAIAFGFTARGLCVGEGDGNGVVEGVAGCSQTQGFLQNGEVLTFWADLTVGKTLSPLNNNLIEGTYSAYASPGVSGATISLSNASLYYPPAKIGRSNSVYVYSTGGINYFGVAPITTVNAPPVVDSLGASMTVKQAYDIDKKMDDGFPATGNVTATWDSGALSENAIAPAVNAAASDSATSCYNSSTTAGAYSLSISNGANTNCALSFRFQ